MNKSVLSCIVLLGLSAYFPTQGFAVENGAFMDWSYASGLEPKARTVQTPVTEYDFEIDMDMTDETISGSSSENHDTAEYEEQNTVVGGSAYDYANQRGWTENTQTFQETAPQYRPVPIETLNAPQYMQTVGKEIAVEYPMTKQYPVSVQYPVVVQKEITVQRPMIVQQPIVVQRPIIMKQPVMVQQQPIMVQQQPIMVQQQPTVLQQQPIIMSAQQPVMSSYIMPTHPMQIPCSTSSCMSMGTMPVSQAYPNTIGY